MTKNQPASHLLPKGYVLAVFDSDSKADAAVEALRRRQIDAGRADGNRFTRFLRFVWAMLMEDGPDVREYAAEASAGHAVVGVHATTANTLRRARAVLTSYGGRRLGYFTEASQP
jgi:hypothetical protein